MSVCLYFIGHLHGNLIEGYSIKTFPLGTSPPPLGMLNPNFFALCFSPWPQPSPTPPSRANLDAPGTVQTNLEYGELLKMWFIILYLPSGGRESFFRPDLKIQLFSKIVAIQPNRYSFKWVCGAGFFFLYCRIQVSYYSKDIDFCNKVCIGC